MSLAGREGAGGAMNVSARSGLFVDCEAAILILDKLVCGARVCGNHPVAAVCRRCDLRPVAGSVFFTRCRAQLQRRTARTSHLSLLDIETLAMDAIRHVVDDMRREQDRRRARSATSSGVSETTDVGSQFSRGTGVCHERVPPREERRTC